MTCPKCKPKKSTSRVVDSRVRGDRRYRRHECRKCGHRWSTFEFVFDGNALAVELRRLRYHQNEILKRMGKIEQALKVS